MAKRSNAGGNIKPGSINKDAKKRVEDLKKLKGDIKNGSLMNSWGNKGNDNKSFIYKSAEDHYNKALLNFKNHYPSDTVATFHEMELSFQKAQVNELTHLGTKRSPIDSRILTQAENLIKYIEAKMGKTESAINHSNSNKVKIQWNDQKNVLIDLFRQLKNIHLKGQKTLISNSYEDITEFLLNNFSCFDNNARSTVLAQLKRKSEIKTGKQIEIKVSK